MPFHFLFADLYELNEPMNRILSLALNIHFHSGFLYYLKIHFHLKLYEINKTYYLQKYAHLVVFHANSENYYRFMYLKDLDHFFPNNFQ